MLMQVYEWGWIVLLVLLIVLIPTVLVFDLARRRRGRYESNYGYFSPDYESFSQTGLFYGYHAGPYTGRGPKGYRRTDSRIAEEINDRLTVHGDVDASEIELDVREGHVTLMGRVDDRRQRRLAEEIADSVPGITDIHNAIVVSQRREAGPQAA